MHDGRIVEVGTHSQLVELEGGHYSALVARQLGQLAA
jgi:ABC-type multidrug transport system fused ATPase/permease subunit